MLVILKNYNDARNNECKKKKYYYISELISCSTDLIIFSSLVHYHHYHLQAVIRYLAMAVNFLVLWCPAVFITLTTKGHHWTPFLRYFCWIYVFFVFVWLSHLNISAMCIFSCPCTNISDASITYLLCPVCFLYLPTIFTGLCNPPVLPELLFYCFCCCCCCCLVVHTASVCWICYIKELSIGHGSSFLDYFYVAENRELIRFGYLSCIGNDIVCLVTAGTCQQAVNWSWKHYLSTSVINCNQYLLLYNNISWLAANQLASQEGLWTME